VNKNGHRRPLSTAKTTATQIQCRHSTSVDSTQAAAGVVQIFPMGSGFWREYYVSFNHNFGSLNRLLFILLTAIILLALTE
jgi:hypothetical protein